MATWSVRFLSLLSRSNIYEKLDSSFEKLRFIPIEGHASIWKPGESSLEARKRETATRTAVLKAAVWVKRERGALKDGRQPARIGRSRPLTWSGICPFAVTTAKRRTDCQHYERDRAGRVRTLPAALSSSMRTSAFGLLALAAAASAVFDAFPGTMAVSAAATTMCPLYLQSRVASTLTNPIKEVVKKKTTTSGSSDSSGDGDATVGSNDSSDKTKTKDGSSTGSSGGTSGDTAGIATTPKPSTGFSTTPTTAPSPTPTTAAPKTTTPTTTTAPATTAPTSGSAAETTATTTGATTPTPTTKAPTSRNLLTVTASAGSGIGVTVTTTLTPSTTSATAGIATTVTTPAITTTPLPTSVSTDTVLNSTTVDSITSSNITSSATNTTTTAVTAADTFTCDETFYNQWTTLGITCGSASIDVSAAVAASSCVIYSGSVGVISGSTCVSICSFPACTDGAWVYGSSNGLASSVYSKYGLDSFMTATMKSRLEVRSSASSAFLSNSIMNSTKQCDYSSESSFSACSCSALLVDAASDAEKKQEREANQAVGVIPEDSTSLAGNVLGPTSKSIAGVTVVISSIAAVASSVVSGASAAGASAAAVGANVAVMTVELCQFGVFINQMDLQGKSAALSLFGKQMAPAAFTFLPFGKLNSTEEEDEKTRRLMSMGRRRLATDVTAPDSGIAKYSRTLGIKEDMLFLVTLAGVIVVMAGVLAVFGIAYFASGLFMPREDFMAKFFDKMIGLQLLILILSQYTIGVTGTYQIYHSVELKDPMDPKCILAGCSLLFLAIGIIFYGYIIVNKHEADLKDVGTVAHMKKAVNMRYGPLYDEYKFKNRFFFAPKMMLALVTGCATGYVGATATYQVSIVLGAHVLFFFYLEMKSPHHSRFVQTTTSFVTIMKIAVLVLTFFLISAAAADGFPSELQNGISLAIVGLNLFVLFLLMIRSIYTFWKKYQLQRDAKFDEEDEQTAQEYFKDETPQQKEQPVAMPSSQSQYQQQQSKQNLLPQQQAQPKSPYITNQTDYNIDEDRNGGEEIRLRSGTHMQQEAERSSYDSRPYDVNRRTAANHYIADERAGYGQRRNDVVEL